MECDRKQIIEMMKNIRAGNPPRLPDGKTEVFFILKHALGSFGSFGIRAWLSGTRIGTAWLLQYKQYGITKRKHLGSVQAIDLDGVDGAFEAAKVMAAKIQLGALDPVAAKKEAMRVAKVTFRPVAEAYLASKDLRQSTMYHWRRFLLDGYHFRPLHSEKLDEITAGQINTCIDDIKRKSGSATAASAWSPMSGLFKWAIRTGRLRIDHVNPMGHVPQPAGSEPRKRVLSNEEIAAIWTACNAWEAEAIHDQQILASGSRLLGKLGKSQPCMSHPPRIVKLLFLTGLRKQEIGDLQWDSEIDEINGEIRIPGERTKNGEILHNPLCDMALEILRSVEKRPGNPYLFGYRGYYSQAPYLTRRINEYVVTVGKPPLAHWTIHDIRRTFRTRLSQLNVPKHVAAALIGHKSAKEKGAVSDVDEGYDRHEYWAEKREALAKWESLLRSIIDGTAPKVVVGKFGRRSA
jgi:integrase